MSYILEALKKAEAERQMSQVPTLNTAQGFSHTNGPGQSNTRRWWFAVGLTLLSITLLGTWIWRTYGGALQRRDQAVVSQPPTSVTLPSAVIVPDVESTSSPHHLPEAAKQSAKVPSSEEPNRPAATQVTRSSSPSPLPGPTKAPSLPTAPVAANAPALSHEASARSTAMPAKAPSAMPDAPGTAKPLPTPIVRTSGTLVPTLAELPDALRAQIPTLNITGAVHADSPQEWALIINDQVLTRGGQVTADLRLEELTSNTAVFNFKGQRFRIDR